MSATESATALERELRTHADPVRAASEKAYLKSGLEFIGTGVPAMRAVVRQFYRARKDLDHPGVVALVEALWAEPVHERRMCAVEMLQFYAAVLEADDLLLVERLIRGARTWALVDELAARVAGGLVERFPALTAELDRWAADTDFWVRRSALLALLLPIRRGEGDFERFGGYADAMLGEKEFFIRKAIGWILRETGKRRPELVFAWLAPRTDRASGLTVREAIKYLPEDRGAALLDAYLEGRPQI